MRSLEEHYQFESLLGDVSAKLVNLSLDKIDSSITETMKDIVEFFDVDRCHIGKLDKVNTKITVSHFYSIPGLDIPQVTDVDKQFLSFIFDSIRDGKTIAVENMEDLPRIAAKDRHYFTKNDITSFILIPLKLDDNTRVGLALSAVGRQHSWPDHTIQHITILFNIMANVLQRRSALEQVVSEKTWTDSVLDGMPQLAYVFNKEGLMKRWNKNVEDVLGFSAEELKDKFVGEFIAEYDREKVLAEVQAIFGDGQERMVAYDIVTKSGGKIPYYGSGKRVEIDDEFYMIGMTVDMVEMKEAQQKIELQLDEIKRLKDQLQAENVILREEIESTHSYKDIIGESESLKHILYRIEQVAPQDTTVLLEGETGTGKELFAHAVHQKSKRGDKPFIKVNCSSLPANLIESELFGHEKGAFTGAVRRQIGRFELADGGTIFLDEISEIPIELQAKLLRVLQEGEFERIGSSNTIKVDVRVIAATNRDLEEDIRNNRFRKDLFYRLNVYPISIVPLRSRSTDIPILVEHFVNRFNKKMGKKIKQIPKNIIQNLQNYDWPGNIRELENVVERAVILSPGSNLKIEKLQTAAFESIDDLQPLAEFERNYIIRVLEKTLWRVDGPDGAARILDMHPETLRSRMRKLEIRRPSSKQ